jgi:putative nucleotidyltransferase with HDIG domain
LGERIVGQGGTPEQALWAARLARFKENPRVEYIPTVQPLTFSERLEWVRSVLAGEAPIYLVGGAVRDALLGRATHDLDFVMPSGALAAGRRVANALKAAYYPLDKDRQTARVVFIALDGTREVLDFAVMRGPDLESDLRARDFTINAIAIDLRQPHALLDPLGGAADLHARRLRACSPSAFGDDPVRILRGVRLAAEFGLRIQRETLKDMREAVGQLARTSAERKRDELFRILDGDQPAAALQTLQMIGALHPVLPETSALKGLDQSPPHVADVWTHTLDVLRNLEVLLKVLAPVYDPNVAANLPLGLLSMRLGRYRQQLDIHLKTPLTPERSMRALLFLAALYHDIAKPQTRQVDEQDRVRFFDHDVIGATLAETRASSLRLSNTEIDRLKTIVRYHMRPILLGQVGHPPTPRAIYRFFRDTAEAGVDICLLSLADVLATYGPALPTDVWERHLDTVRLLLEAWWETPEEHVDPPPLLGGNDLLLELRLKPGVHIGKVLEYIREAQVAGQVKDRESALALARSWLAEHGIDYG